MKLSQWNERTAAKLEKLAGAGEIVACNTADGVVFSDKAGTWCKYVSGSHLLAACWNREIFADALRRHWKHAMEADAALADSKQAGTVGGLKCCKFSARDFTMEVFVYEKILRQFPKNTMFYLQGTNKPVIAGIWEAGQLHIIGLVMPFHLQGREFVPAA